MFSAVKLTLQGHPQNFLGGPEIAPTLEAREDGLQVGE